MKRRSRSLVHATDAAAYVNAFALTGIVTVLATRAFLALAGYPKLGGSGGSRLHIAHMLWGGLLMAAAVLLTLGFLGRAARLTGAVVGGAGFGLFIDEVGKQITDEPGYFYQPAAGIIYLSFASLLLLTHLIRGRTADSSALDARQRTAHAADHALAGVTTGLPAEQRQAAIRLVEGSDREVDAALVRLLAALPERPPAAPTRWRTWADGAGRALRWLARTRVVLGAAVLCLLTEALLFAVWMSMDFFGGQLAREPQPGAHLVVALTEVASAALGIAGLIRLRGDRRAALRLFRAALLVDILVGQIFKFTMDQFAAVIELGIDLGLLWVVSAFLAAQATVQSAALTSAQTTDRPTARTTVQPAARSAVPEVVPPVVSEAR
ncbi:hypothetical protein [Streptomyces sp. KN37]|uniref:hypothetical protein n=1 Tax=Streptomyces sp. KN37 TaxID=3090667 RepID=UPI002A756AE6|nr:hypothetical protein [Streptomyces sp. KN37]WPO72083.1 hypothetical protein R9806_16290 [Streptomyces sp. KN37]